MPLSDKVFGGHGSSLGRLNLFNQTLIILSKHLDHCNINEHKNINVNSEDEIWLQHLI